MSDFKYKTNGEELTCVNCKNTEFKRLAPANGLVPYECQRCHFVSWFPEDFAPTEAPRGK